MQTARLTASNHELDKELAVKSEQLRLLIKEDEAKQPKWSATPLYKSEDEEELDYALQSGKISVDEHQALLKQAGFENTNIELAPEISDVHY